MHRCCTIFSFLFFSCTVYAQQAVSFEQYSFVGAGQNSLLAPVAHYQSRQKWYAEARYNYEDIRTFSLYGGRTFSRDNEFSWSLTPVLGAIAGKMNGGSFGLNSACSYHKFNFSSQAQYSISAESRYENFFYNWAEFCYQPATWFYTGIALQHTRMYATHAVADPGLLMAFSVGQWTVPLYSFNTFGGERYYVLGINWEWKHGKSQVPKQIPIVLAAGENK
jgi:hypothetical protein